MTASAPMCIRVYLYLRHTRTQTQTHTHTHTHTHLRHTRARARSHTHQNNNTTAAAPDLGARLAGATRREGRKEQGEEGRRDEKPTHSPPLPHPLPTSPHPRPRLPPPPSSPPAGLRAQVRIHTWTAPRTAPDRAGSGRLGPARAGSGEPDRATPGQTVTGRDGTGGFAAFSLRLRTSITHNPITRSRRLFYNRAAFEARATSD